MPPFLQYHGGGRYRTELAPAIQLHGNNRSWSLGLTTPEACGGWCQWDHSSLLPRHEQLVTLNLTWEMFPISFKTCLFIQEPSSSYLLLLRISINTQAAKHGPHPGCHDRWRRECPSKHKVIPCFNYLIINIFNIFILFIVLSRLGKSPTVVMISGLREASWSLQAVSTFPARTLSQSWP